MFIKEFEWDNRLARFLNFTCHVAHFFAEIPADFAFVDSQQPELPYHICVIRDFKYVSHLIIQKYEFCIL